MVFFSFELLKPKIYQVRNTPRIPRKLSNLLLYPGNFTFMSEQIKLLILILILTLTREITAAPQLSSIRSYFITNMIHKMMQNTKLNIRSYSPCT